MKKRLIVGTVCALLLAVTVGIRAQNPTASVQENPQILTGPSFGQNYSTAGAQGTITINPTQPCTYIWEIDAQPFNGTNTTVTNGFTTLTAGNLVMKWAVGVGATAQAMGTGFTFSPAGKPLKTSASTITLQTPATLANATWQTNIWYSFGPC